MRRIALTGLLAVVGFLCMHPAIADTGFVPFDPDAQVFEPNQRAMIAWNGTQEILLLTTDLKASKETKVLEVLPLPSEPKVKKGDIEVFRRAVSLINAKRRRPQYFYGRSLSAGPTAAESSRPAGEVTFHKKIGAHDISVTHVLNKGGFVSWVEKYLKSAGVGNPTVPEPMKKVVGEYLRDGFAWFVFDVVELDDRLKTKEAIAYRFKTDTLFYPLKITSTGKGKSTVDLVVLTERPVLLKSYSGTFRLRHALITINSEEAHTISGDMASLFPDVSKMTLRIWRLEGLLSAFDKDLIAQDRTKKRRAGGGTSRNPPESRAGLPADDNSAKLTSR